MRRLRDEFSVQLFPNTRYLLLGLLLRRLLYAKREEGTRHETRRENAVLPRRDPSGPVNLHLARRQMSAQPELSLYASRYNPLLFASPFRSLDSARRLLSFFIQIPSRGIIKRETLIARKRITSDPRYFERRGVIQNWCSGKSVVISIIDNRGKCRRERKKERKLSIVIHWLFRKFNWFIEINLSSYKH